MKKKICPRCGSNNITTIQQAYGMAGGRFTYRCADCGYENYNFPEIDE